jgi:malonate-semialdehyde dehydrogenase (acetylating)/methylmalonate-semialdehyde dehydrogenase
MSTSLPTIGHFIDGARVDGASTRYKDIFDPNTGAVQARVAMATTAELDAAVKSAAKAQVAWANTNPQKRSRILFAYKALVETHMEELAHIVAVTSFAASM